MRTFEEILKRMEEVKNDDLFGAKIGDMVIYLPFDLAKPYLREGINENDWPKYFNKLTKKNVINKIKEYLPFAWGKANDCRGTSAGRSIDHMSAWLWLLNDGSYEKMQDIEYEHYGKEILVFVSEHVGFDWKQHDDGLRTNYDY